MTPRFTHDCEGCEFKGQQGIYDIWYCARCDRGTWIARYGSEGSEYASYPTFVLDIHRGQTTADSSLAAIFAVGA